jgi:outer membrane protein OmpA-like peptidoglycan-associated protein
MTVASATPPPPAGAPSAANSVALTFVTGSAQLPQLAADALKQLAARRGNGVIAVVGYGDATSNDPDAQAAALTLGLSRAKAMAAALTAAGVPASAVQVDAEAIGRGGMARLVQ